MGFKSEIRLVYYKLKYVFKFGSPYFKDDHIFENKRIIVIGAANSSLNYLHGSEIDKFDLIVRINNTPAIAEQFPDQLGTKTDVLFSCLNNFMRDSLSIRTVQNLKKNKTKYVLFPEGGRRKALRKFYKFSLGNPDLKVKRFTDDFWKEVTYNYPSGHPTTGTSALLYLLRQNFSELHITGFTFYKTNYVSAYAEDTRRETAFNNAMKYHNPPRDFEMFLDSYKQVLQLGKRVFIDEELNRILTPLL